LVHEITKCAKEVVDSALSNIKDSIIIVIGIFGIDDTIVVVIIIVNIGGAIVVIIWIG